MHFPVVVDSTDGKFVILYHATRICKRHLENLEELEKTGPCPCLLSSSNSAPNEVANGSFARVDLIRVGGSCGVVT